MFKDITFLPVDQMKGLRPSLDTVVVSVLDRSEAYARPRLGGFRSVLQLEFEDTYEELKCAAPGSWPDEPSDEEHARFAQGAGERVPTLTDAARIVEFLHRHHRDATPLTLVAHCFGGVSRSAAIAHWASVRFWVPIRYTKLKTTDHANRRLLRLLDKADGRC